MRKVTDHVVENDSANQLRIIVLDEPGQGGACHQYAIDTDGETSDRWRMRESLKHLSKHQLEDENECTHGEGSCLIHFQNGPIKENGVNGVTQEALLAIVIDRLRSFQAGPFSCRDNAVALTHCEEALMWLQRRTRERIKRGVEGTTQK